MEVLFYHFFAALLLVAIFVLIAMTVGAARQGTAIARLFALWTGGASLWATGTFLTLLTTTPAWWRVWMFARICVAASMAVISIAFVARYTGRGAWLRPRVLVTMSIVPGLTILMVLFGRTDWIMRDMRLVSKGPYTILLGMEPGAWFGVHVIYSLTLVVLALGILFLQIFRSFHLYRWRTAILFLGALLSFVPTVLSLFQPFGIPPMNWSAIGVSLTGLVWYWALFRYRMLDVMPFARDAIVESIDDAVLILDADGRVVDLNPPGAELVGHERTQSIGRALHALGPGGAALAAVVGETEGARREAALEMRPGETRYYDLRTSPVSAGGTEAVAQVIVLRDVSERVRLVQDLDAYAHAVAHDLKNPLTGVIGCLELVRGSEGQRIEGELARLVDGGAEAADKMQAIIDGLLLLASVRRQQDVPRERLDMGSIVDAVVRTRLGGVVRESAAELRGPEHWPPAVGYAPWVEEVWANYLSNAIKYGGRPPLVEVGADPLANGTVRFWVRDNGGGLDDAQRGAVFEEFSRLQPTRAEGHGLGLSVVRRIVEKLGGQVGVDSEPGKGSRFWFTLPA